MAEEQRVRVKISSEEAGAISMTQVVSQELTLRELVEYMLPLAGKDSVRLRELLRRGTLVSGASRFRWTGWDAGEADILAILSTFPDPDPSRAFAAERCVHASLHGRQRNVEVSRDAGRARRGASLWDVLMELAAAAEYAGYSYRRRADRFTVSLTPVHSGRLREAAERVIYTTVRDQLRATEVASVEFFVER